MIAAKKEAPRAELAHRSAAEHPSKKPPEHKPFLPVPASPYFCCREECRCGRAGIR
jgi:hypothetical protein